MSGGLVELGWFAGGFSTRVWTTPIWLRAAVMACAACVVFCR